MKICRDAFDNATGFNVLQEKSAVETKKIAKRSQRVASVESVGGQTSGGRSENFVDGRRSISSEKDSRTENIESRQIFSLTVVAFVDTTDG